MVVVPGIAVECVRESGERVGPGRAIVRTGSGAKIRTCELRLDAEVTSALRVELEAGGAGSVRLVIRFGPGDERVLSVTSAGPRALIGVLEP